MSDPKPLKVFTCYDPTGRTKSCYLLMEDEDEIRREHRAWHANEEAVKEGFRRAIGSKDDTISKLRQEIVDLRRDVKGIEIPTPVLGLTINRDGYSEDELDQDPEPDVTASVYADDDVNATVAMDPADLPQPPATSGVDMYGNRVTT